MFTYAPTNPFVYIEPTVISCAVADPSTNAKLALWQAESRRFLNAYQHQLAFVVSDAVLNEIRKGDPSQAQKRLTAIAHFAKLPMTPARVRSRRVSARHHLHADNLNGGTCRERIPAKVSGARLRSGDIHGSDPRRMLPNQTRDQRGVQ